MPYALPSPGTSPTVTMTIPATPRAEQKRPVRHHQRSVSSDAIPSTSSFIYVHPATPQQSAESSTSSNSWSRAAVDSAAGPSSPNPLPRRRIKLFGFTPTSAAADDGPSSQEESASEGQQDDQATPRAEQPRTTGFTFGQSPTLVPVPSRTVSTPNAHVESLKTAFGSRRTAMVRKKSGELVRSSLKTGDALRRETKPRSAPATPVCPKYVHFDTQLEHVKHFLAQQRPAAVSRSGSPVETETEDEPESFPFPAMASASAGSIKLKLPNFPTRLNHDQDVYIESLEIGKDGKSIRGIVRVRNLSFEKWVAIRFTLDHWQTVSEVSAEHHESMGANSDRFVFNIRLQDLLSRIEEKTMFIAVRYTVGGREIWDNNDGQNYKVEFIKVPAPQVVPVGVQTATGKRQTWSVTNAGQAADRMADLRRELDRLVGDEVGPPTLRSPDTRSFTEGSPSALSNRYDFSHSLKLKVAPRTNSYEPYAPSSSPPKASAMPYFAPSSTTTGMPYRPPVTTSAPAPSNRSGEISPSMRRADLPPDFGAPSTTKSSYQASSPLYNPTSLYTAPVQSAQRPPSPSPPSEMGLKSLYQQYLSHPDVANYQASPARFNTHPGHGNKSASSTSSLPPSMHYAPLLPPTFRQHRRRDSPFASPAASPFGSPAGSPYASPGDTPVDSPVVSPARSPPRASSPPLYPTISPPSEMAFWSPASSSDAMSNSSSATNHSPDSEATSVPESPSAMSPRPQGPLEFSTFLDRYCFHTSSQPTSLGLVGVGDANSPFPSPLPMDFNSTPRRGTPLANNSPASSNCGSRAYFSTSSQNSSGSSTPATGQDNPLEGFAAYAPPPAPSAIVS